MFSCGIIVAMATRLLNLQGVLFLNHNIQWLFLKYDDDRYLYSRPKVTLHFSFLNISILVLILSKWNIAISFQHFATHNS